MAIKYTLTNQNNEFLVSTKGSSSWTHDLARAKILSLPGIKAAQRSVNSHSGLFGRTKQITKIVEVILTLK